MKAVIYARYSTEMQREASIEDQVRLCRERAAREGWEVVNVYADHGLSGASLMRPGLQQLMRDAQGGQFDLFLPRLLTACPAIRRTSRVCSSACALPVSGLSRSPKARLAICTSASRAR